MVSTVGSHLKRREVVTLLGGFGAALPALVARGQVLTKPALIGILVAGSKEATQPRVSGFPQGMQELGYVQGRNYMIEGRYGDGDLARLRLGQHARREIDAVQTA